MSNSNILKKQADKKSIKVNFINDFNGEIVGSKDKFHQLALNLIENRNKTTVKNGTKLEAVINSQTKTVEYPLSARLVKTGSGISTGTFKSHLEFTLLYN